MCTLSGHCLLGHRLVEGRSAGCGARPDVRNGEQLEHLAQRAVLARLAVQQRKHARWALDAQGREESRVDIAFVDLGSEVAQGL